MVVQGCCRKVSGYLFMFLLILLTAGCSSGGDSGGGRNGAVGFVDIQTDPGPIITVEVGQEAVLDGSDSSPQGTVSFAWSFSHKPDLSDAVLLDANSPNPRFTPDVRGSYMVQLIVTSRGVVSGRDIALVEATTAGDPLDRPPFLHFNLKSRCTNCHNESSTNASKSGDHVATSNLCQACHTTFGFDIIPFVDHLEVSGECSSCHDGVIAVGKSSSHVPTVLECDECHNTNSFLELGLDGSYDHSDISGGCENCHNGVIAVGKHEGHIATLGEDCNRCHSIVAFTPAFVYHAFIDFNVTTCVSCHDGAGPGVSTIGKTVTHPATSDNCQVCHNTETFNLNGNFDHDAIDDEVITCETCHDGNHTAAGARGKTSVPPHPDTTTDCGACHTTDDFANYYVDHTSIEVTSVRCDSCHGVSAVGMPTPNHINTSLDCDFATGVFDHDPGVIGGARCDACHNDVITIGKVGNHVPTTLDCGACHDTVTFTGATVDHTSIVDGCADCHDGSFATGKVDAIPAHIPTLDDCSGCHGVTLPLAFAPSNFAHVGITNNCESCHDGSFTTPANNIQGKPADHIPTVDDCITCHAIAADFTNGTFDHAGLTRGCAGCHNGRFTTDTGTILGKPSISIVPTVPDDPSLHVPTTQDCYFCHSYDAAGWAASVPTVFAHTGISDNCTSCHDGTYVTMGALDKASDPDHQVTTADCGACHTTTAVAPNGVSFLNAFQDHTGIVDNCGSAGCHDPGTPEGIYAATPPHNPTNGNDCELCHTSGGNWANAVFDHSNISRDTRCDSCHNGTDSIGKDAKVNPPHIPTTDDCRVCHNTTSFAGATFDHSNVSGNTRCDSCHNGNAATGTNGIVCMKIVRDAFYSCKIAPGKCNFLAQGFAHYTQGFVG